MIEPGYIRELARHADYGPDWETRTVDHEKELEDGRFVMLRIRIRAVSMCERGQGYIAQSEAEILSMEGFDENGDDIIITDKERQMLVDWAERSSDELAEFYLQ